MKKLLPVVLFMLCSASYVRVAPVPRMADNIPADLCFGAADVTIKSGTTTWSTDGTRGCVKISGGTLNITGGTQVITTIHQTGGTVNVSAGVTITFADSAIDTDNDPEQWGHGWVASAGVIRINGTSKTAYLRTTAAPKKSATVIALASSPITAAWQVGDTLYIPDTRHLKESDLPVDYNNVAFVTHRETCVIDSLSSSTVTCKDAIAYDHACSVGAAPTYCPHLVNVTRDTVIQSANTDDAVEPSPGVRGHLLFTMMADVRITGVQLKHMGRTVASNPAGGLGGGLNCTLRTTGAVQASEPFFHTCTTGTGPVTHIGTNHIGRYPIHFHHLHGPGNLSPQPQFLLTGSAIVDSHKWPIAVHDSHYGEVSNNAMVTYQGAGLMVEDGSETANQIHHNFAMNSNGQFGERDAHGREPTGFYFRGPNNYVHDNVAANMRGSFGRQTNNSGYGFKYFMQGLGNIAVPTAQGQDPGNYATVAIADKAILQFDDNEVYGATESGYTTWWVGINHETPSLTVGRSYLRRNVVWNTYNLGYFVYETHNLYIQDFIVRGNEPVSGPLANSTGILFNDYPVSNFTGDDLDIRGEYIGMFASSNQVKSAVTTFGQKVINSTFDDNQLDWYASTLWSVVANRWALKDNDVTLINTTFGSPKTIYKHHTLAAHDGGNLIARQDVYVYSYQGDPAKNFKVYSSAQLGGAVMDSSKCSSPPCRSTKVTDWAKNEPGNPYSTVGSPDAGRTNAQNWADYGIATNGEIMPVGADNTTYPEINGYTFAIPPLPSASKLGLRIRVPDRPIFQRPSPPSRPPHAR